jgi:hypothetical protein
LGGCANGIVLIGFNQPKTEGITDLWSESGVREPKCGYGWY